MNTGTQASLSTFWKARTTTSPGGKTEERRNLALIMAVHKANYVATASVGYLRDLRKKFRRASEMNGFRFIHVHTPCPPGWKFPSEKTVEVARKAVMSGAWILWEYDGKFKLSSAGKRYAEKQNRIPLADYLRQGRFSHLSEEEIKELKRKIEEDWELLLKFF